MCALSFFTLSLSDDIEAYKYPYGCTFMGFFFIFIAKVLIVKIISVQQGVHFAQNAYRLFSIFFLTFLISGI